VAQGKLLGFGNESTIIGVTYSRTATVASEQNQHCGGEARPEGPTLKA